MFQDGSILIMKSPPPPSSQKCTFFTYWPIDENLVVNGFFPSCTYVSSVMRSFADTLVTLYAMEGTGTKDSWLPVVVPRVPEVIMVVEGCPPVAVPRVPEVIMVVEGCPPV